MKIAKILVIGGLVVLGSWAAYVGMQPAPSSKLSATGQPAPAFSLPAVPGGSTVSLADFQGKVVLVNFWATWCPPCRGEVPDFVKVHNELRPRGFEIVGISLDNGAPEVMDFMREHQIQYAVGMGNREVASSYGGVDSIPTSFLVNRQGQVIKRFEGPIDAERLRNEVEPLL